MHAWASERISPRLSPRSTTLVVRHHAMTTGSLIRRAELGCFLHGRKRPYHGAVEHPFAAQICALDHRVPSTELIGKLGLQAAERRRRFGFGFLRGELHDKA